MTDEPIITQAEETYEERLDRISNEVPELGPEQFANGKSVGRIMTVYTGTFTCRLCLNQFWVFRGSREFCPDACDQKVWHERLRKVTRRDAIADELKMMRAILGTDACRLNAVTRAEEALPEGATTDEAKAVKFGIPADHLIFRDGPFKFDSMTVEGGPRVKPHGTILHEDAGNIDTPPEFNIIKAELPVREMLEQAGLDPDTPVDVHVNPGPGEIIPKHEGWFAPAVTVPEGYQAMTDMDRVILNHPETIIISTRANLGRTWVRVYSGADKNFRTILLEERP